ncbi:MAG TPA: DNA-processing protein DprA [Candidatus Saccharimonadales bacterium]|nr:DNA-processing protein DprA [Candidatus Saccharimonadales bacterium]
MYSKKVKLTGQGLPEELRRIPSPPKQLFCRGADLAELMGRPRVAIVGSRSVTPYGRQVTSQLAAELAGQDIVIISGLAIGVDAIAHQAAVEAGGLAIAVLPGPVDKVYPATNRRLAERILAQGGALISEYEVEEFSFKQNFVARNRLVAGLAQALLITEAAEKSGSLHTARFALEQGKDVLAVPGNITSQVSVGTNNLLKTGAMPVTSYQDVLHALGLHDHQTPAREVRGRNAHEQTVLDLLLRGINDGQALLERSALSVSEFNQALTMLEIGGKIRALGGNHWALQ